MSNYIVTDSELTSVANAIRTKGGTNGSLVFPGGFTSAINAISGGGSSDFTTAEVTITITGFDTAESVYMVLEYMDVPNTIYDMGSIQASMTWVLNNGKITVPLIKGKALIGDNDLGLMCLYDSEYNIVAVFSALTSVAGNITDDGMSLYTITGDCTLNISWVEQQL